MRGYLLFELRVTRTWMDMSICRLTRLDALHALNGYVIHPIFKGKDSYFVISSSKVVLVSRNRRTIPGLASKITLRANLSYSIGTRTPENALPD